MTAHQLLVDTLSGVRAMILEAKSEGIPYSVGTATYLYALIDAIALEPRGQDVMDKWVAANLVPVMLALANMPAIRCRPSSSPLCCDADLNSLVLHITRR